MNMPEISLEYDDEESLEKYSEARERYAKQLGIN